MFVKFSTLFITVLFFALLNACSSNTTSLTQVKFLPGDAYVGDTFTILSAEVKYEEILIHIFLQ
ncbi:MAG: hypothetical protein ACJAWS_001478 [Oleiphilaceae bacterium]|jgi:hypothetical protein